MFLLDKIDKLLRVHVLEEIESRGSYRLLHLFEYFLGFSGPQGRFEDFARVIDASLGNVLLRHGEVMEFLDDHLADLRRDIVELGDFRGEPLDIVFFKIFQNLR